MTEHPRLPTIPTHESFRLLTGVSQHWSAGGGPVEAGQLKPRHCIECQPSAERSRTTRSRVNCRNSGQDSVGSDSGRATMPLDSKSCKKCGAHSVRTLARPGRDAASRSGARLPLPMPAPPPCCASVGCLIEIPATSARRPMHLQQAGDPWLQSVDCPTAGLPPPPPLQAIACLDMAVHHVQQGLRVCLTETAGLRTARARCNAPYRPPRSMICTQDDHCLILARSCVMSTVLPPPPALSNSGCNFWGQAFLLWRRLAKCMLTCRLRPLR